MTEVLNVPSWLAIAFSPFGRMSHFRSPDITVRSHSAGHHLCFRMDYGQWSAQDQGFTIVIGWVMDPYYYFRKTTHAHAPV